MPTVTHDGSRSAELGLVKDLVLFWSGGKDCATALYELLTADRYRGRFRVTRLLTTLTEDYDRVSGHGVRSSVLDLQAACLGLDLQKTYISRTSTMHQYECVIEKALLEGKDQGAKAAASGDIFIEKRRMSSLRNVGLLACFPLYGRDAGEHMKAVVELGFEAYVVCVDSGVLDQSFVGCRVDRDFLNRLPPGVDPCGENGEYHTFVVDGPIFGGPVPCTRGQVVFRDGFYFCDLLPDC